MYEVLCCREKAAKFNLAHERTRQFFFSKNPLEICDFDFATMREMKNRPFNEWENKIEESFLKKVYFHALNWSYAITVAI